MADTGVKEQKMRSSGLVQQVVAVARSLAIVGVYTLSWLALDRAAVIFRNRARSFVVLPTACAQFCSIAGVWLALSASAFSGLAD